MRPPFLRPTSGLDSFSALVVMHQLKAYCEAGVTVICTIHQPRSAIWALFQKARFTHPTIQPLRVQTALPFDALQPMDLPSPLTPLTPLSPPSPLPPLPSCTAGVGPELWARAVLRPR